jgi:hypothetical protein
MNGGNDTVKRNALISVAAVAALCMADLAVTNVAQAFDFGNMMNPSRWFGGDHDRYDRYDRYGYGGPYGWGGGPYGYGGGPYGWGGGPYGYGGGPYGWGGGPYGYGGGQPSTIVVNPPDNAKRVRVPE